MRKKLTIVLLAFGMLVSCNTSPQKTKHAPISEAVRRMLEAHPQSTLQDIYKSCFQDAFGPGHLVNDTAAARRYLQSELAENDYIDTVLTEPTGIDGNYVRINLQLVKRGDISEETLLEALIESANNATPPSQDEWRGKWHEIVSEISAMGLGLPNFVADSIMIEQLLSEGKYVMHHSEFYSQTYHPHYRIVKKNLAP